LNNLDWAALNGIKDVVLILLDHKVDVTKKNNNGKTASEEAFDRELYEISEKIAEKEPTSIVEDNDENTEEVDENI
jgi:hypothetical protein